MASTNSRRDGRQIPWKYGAVSGIGAYVLSYVLTFFLWSTTEFPTTVGGAIREFVTGQVPDWVFSGWLLYNAHFVDVAVTVGMGQTRWNFIDFVGQSSTDILYIVIPGVLLVAGVALARIVGADSAADGAIAGASVVVGYLPLVVVGVFLFAADGNAPVMVQSILLAGLVYPLVVGAVGGGVAAELG